MYRVHHTKCWAAWVTSQNQDCQEKYQQPQIHRWYHSNVRKQRETKEPVDEGEKAGLILWPPDTKSWLIVKDPDAGKDWRREEKGTTEDEMGGRRHWLHGREFEWTPGVGGGQGSLACCRSWGCKESDTTERLNWLIRFERMSQFLARCYKSCISAIKWTTPTSDC